jgi:hypothetical protein
MLMAFSSSTSINETYIWTPCTVPPVGGSAHWGWVVVQEGVRGLGMVAAGGAGAGKVAQVREAWGRGAWAPAYLVGAEGSTCRYKQVHSQS